ncbi:MAG: protease modulator HflC [Lentisphaeria bacterium]|nr:protease modulator HflC [Lentisphaeria bacterium]
MDGHEHTHERKHDRGGIHWPVIILGIIVAVIFIGVLFVFQVRETEYAIIRRFGKPRTTRIDGAEAVKVYKAGLHARLPFVDEVWKHDSRWQCYELRKGQLEQMQTKDDYQIILTTFVVWRIGDPYIFSTAIKTTDKAEEAVSELVRNSRTNSIGKYTLSQLINIDKSHIKITDLERDTLTGVQDIALQKYGIEIKHVGIKHIGFPEQVTQKVFERMRTDRQRRANNYRSDGERDAKKIRAAANERVQEILANAHAEATRIRGEGDQAAAESYKVFRQNPELAAFLRKLEALRKTMGGKTTLIFDTETPPYDLLRPGAGDLLSPKSGDDDTTPSVGAEK